MPSVIKLQQLSSLIATPFVTCKFAGVEFGLATKFNNRTKTREAHYVTSLTIAKKASGAVNTYDMTMDYVVTPGADPNYIDLLISSAQDRKIFFTYGDASQPEYSFRNEQAMITKIVPNLNFSASAISYTFTATSSVSLGYAVQRNYPKKARVKPSDEIYNLLYKEDSGLLELFTGMRKRSKVEENGWISSKDVPVALEAQNDISPLQYLRFLLSQMQAEDKSFFAMLIHDEPTTEDGPYFEIVNSATHQGKGNTYSVGIDVGYPSDTQVYQFTPSQATSLALVTAYQEKIDKPRSININEFGDPNIVATPSMAIKNGKASSALLQWWKSLTAFPITATLKTRGLIKPTILCDFLKIDIYFFGQKYNYSGYYMVTAQKDVVSRDGYSTELSLVRVKGEDDV